MITTGPRATAASTAGPTSVPSPGRLAGTGPAWERGSGHQGQLFALLLAGYPVAWAVGLGLFHHVTVGAMMAAWLIVHRPFRVPAGTGLLALFLLVVSISAVGIQSMGAIALYLLRWSWYAAALVSWVYLARHRRTDGGRLLVRSMLVLWALVVAGGWLSVVFPELGWTTPVARIVPGALVENDLISRFLRPETSETQVFPYQDLILHRPAGPFAYTNGWGSAMALLVPFALAALHDRRVGVPRPATIGLLILAIVPFTAALNRGAWLTLGFGLVYGGVRWARLRRDPRPLALLAIIMAGGLAVGTATGATQSAVDALATRSADSNETRSGLYVETVTEAARSPLIGYGSTRPSKDNPTGPPLGTHGQLWAVLFAHGYLGLGLYTGFFVAALLRARAWDPVQHWAKVSLAIGMLQLPIYGHLPHQLFIMVGAAALASWPSSQDPTQTRKRT